MHEFREKIVPLAKKWGAAALRQLQICWRIFIELCRKGAALVRKYTPVILDATRIYLQIVWAFLKKYSIKAFHLTIAILRQLLIYLHICWQWLIKLGIRIIHFAEAVLRRLWQRLKAEWPETRKRLYQYAYLMRLDRPIGIFLLLWPTLWALWIAAEGVPDTPILIIFILGVVVMRSAGCVINDLADRDIDLHVDRTRNRPLAAGKVSFKEALGVAVVLLLFAFALVMCLNAFAIKLSFVALALAILYPFTKRYTYMPQLFLGLAFGWAVPMAFAAETGTLLPLPGWILLMATILWAVVYDTMYAMVDREDDIRLGIKSTAILFEDADRGIIAVIQILVLLALVLAGSRLEFSRVYYEGLAVAACFSLYQQYLIIDRIPQRCLRAFKNNNWFGAAVFAGIFLHYQLN